MNCGFVEAGHYRGINANLVMDHCVIRLMELPGRPHWLNNPILRSWSEGSRRRRRMHQSEVILH